MTSQVHFAHSICDEHRRAIQRLRQHLTGRFRWAHSEIALSGSIRLAGDCGRLTGGTMTLPTFNLFEKARMPFANYKFPEGTLNAVQKEEIIHRTTNMFVEFFGERVRPFTMVLVDEVADGGWGRADETLTLAKMGLPGKS